MNTAQLIRQALYSIDAVERDRTTADYYTVEELLAWANEAKDAVESIIRQTNADYNTVTRLSTDGSIRFEGVTYATSSFQLLTSSSTYTLPPDLIELRKVRVITAGEEHRILRALDISHPIFKHLQGRDRTETTGGELFYDILGERTLYLAQPPDATLDLEITYVQRTPKLQLYSTGTVSITQDTDDIVGVSSLWVDNALTTPAEIMVSTDTTVPKVVSEWSGGTWVDPSARYAPISTFDTDTAATLLANWLIATVSGVGYLVASVPQIPVEHRHLIASYIAGKCLDKSGHLGAVNKMSSFTGGAARMTASMAERQSVDPVFVEEYE